MIQLSKIFLPTGKIEKTAKLFQTVKLAQIPIIEICLIKGFEQDFYFMAGADFCNGVECPEFYGIYSMNGSVIYEGITTVGPLSKESPSFDSIIQAYSIDINRPDTCQNILAVWQTGKKR
ncbi:MAG: hypothetical protein R3C61_08160 [Bacteroidia bacterium]